MRIVASLVTAALLTGACSGTRWSHPVTVATAQDAPIRTIDLLPTDLEVWADPRVERDLDQVRLSAEARLVGVASETFYQRGYTVGAVLDWEGNYIGPDGEPRRALSPEQLTATVDSLAGYGTLIGESQRVPPPVLPVRLGATTGSDATLYIGGWGFAGKPPDNGKLAGKIVLGAFLVVGVALIIVALAKLKADPGKVLGGTARVAGRAAVSVGRTALRAGSAVVDIGRTVRLDVLEPVLDPIARAALSIPELPQRPVWSNNKALPRKGRPKMYIEMTLVDNRSGRVIWHAHQAYPADPSRPNEVMKAAKLMLRSLPPA